MPEIYYCSTEELKDSYEKGSELLTEARKKRAEKMIREENRLQNLAAGLLMRKVLGVKDDREISYNEHGKPYLEHEKCFNISHSGKYAVLAVSDTEIGADIEKDRDPDERVMKRCFSETETAFVEENGSGFTLLWTLKEAVLKLMGTGLYVSPKKISVLPIEEKHIFFGREIRFFIMKIDDYILSVAFSGDENVTVKRLTSEELINDI